MQAAPEGDPHVEIREVQLRLGSRAVFEDLSCVFPRGRITVLMGGSGAGKSTLLRLIGGLQRPDRGSIQVAGEETTTLSERELYRVRQRLGMLFQGGALLDSLSVLDNVALPLREHTKLSEAEIEREVQRRLDAVGLPGVGDLLPSELSGGMLRRIALARAIIRDPEIVLCDEPFSGLDPLNVRRIEALLTRLNRRLGLTLIVASHHVGSAFRMAHHLVFLLQGAALSGPPAALEASGDPRVQQFFAADREAEAEVRAWEGVDA
jgi:phospholipid/cholesterol/gamma-HCH transport system ATP-binding protein